MTAEEAKARVLARYPDADVEYPEDDSGVWISDDDWTPLSEFSSSVEAAWVSAARRLEKTETTRCPSEL